MKEHGQGLGALGTLWNKSSNTLLLVLRTDYLSSEALNTYNVLLMPDGRYENLQNSDIKKIMEWVSKGGKLIASQRALKQLKDTEFTALKSYLNEMEKAEAASIEKQRANERRFVSYGNQERYNMKKNTPGAIYKVKVDPSHPLAFWIW